MDISDYVILCIYTTIQDNTSNHESGCRIGFIAGEGERATIDKLPLLSTCSNPLGYRAAERLNRVSPEGVNG